PRREPHRARLPARPLVQAGSGAEERSVVVGGGPAAKAAAEAYREAGGAGAVTILAREADPPYERPPLTKDFLRGETRREELALAERRWYKARGIDLRTGTEVELAHLGP